MAQQVEKTLQTVSRGVGSLLLAVVVAVVGSALYQNRDTAIDVATKGWLSDEDRKVLRNPEAANKAAYEKMAREAWEHSQSQQPQGGRIGGWKK
jgi:hypothetical protein